MKINLTAMTIFLALFCFEAARGQNNFKQTPDPEALKLGNGFTSNFAEVNGTTIHYVRGGSGPAIILIHGFPQDWFEFHKIMPGLAKKFTVIAVDTRGIGGSKASVGGYEAANQAKDINELADKLKLKNYYVAGHDMGGMVAYAFARQFAAKSRGVMIIEAPLPGIEPWNEVKTNPLLWHVNFNQVPDLPEKLIMGRQEIYLGYFFKFIKTGISPVESAHFINSHKTADQLRSGFENYRALPANEKFNAAQNNQTTLPIVLVGGENSFGNLIPRFAASLRQKGCQNVKIEIVKNGAHYLADETPDEIAQVIEKYASAE